MVVIALALLGISLFCLRRYRRLKRAMQAIQELDEKSQERSSSYTVQLPDNWRGPEIDGLPKCELEEQRRHELPGKDNAAEMEA